MSHPDIDEVARFMSALDETRSILPRDDWKKLVARDPTIRRWRFFLSADPYTRWDLLKPRGYAGDASLMDFAYGHPSVKDQIGMAGEIGQAIYCHTAAAPMSASARLSVELIATRIFERTELGTQFSAISIASGHARELEGLDNPTRRKINSFTAVDIDHFRLHRSARRQELYASDRFNEMC